MDEEAKFYQDYLDNEDAELDRLNNEIWPEEIAIVIAIIGMIGTVIYYAVRGA